VIIIAFASLRAATQAHLARAAHLRALIEAIPHIVWMSGVDGKITFANERWYDYTGKSPNGGIDAQWIAAIHPADVIESTRAWAHSLRTGAPFEAQYRLAGADGSYRWFVVRGVPERNKRGTIIQWFGTCTDVDAQHSQLENTQRVADTFARAQLPMTLPSSPYVRFDATYLAAEDLLQIGGDWYDVFALDERRFVFSLGDVTGHGLDAAIVMTRIRQTIIALASVESDPAFILEKANAALRLQGDCMVTALCGILDAQSGELVYASAGHPPSLIRHDGGAIDELTSSAPPLGVMDALQVARRHVHMAPGDMLVCYTDGIIENERDLTIGEARLRAVLAKLQTFDRAQAAGVIRERILGGRRGRDDVAILVIDRSGPAYVAERPKAVLTGDPHE
jgi:PAS domain S-box-containing protein